MKLQLFKCEVRGSECNSLIQNLGIFESEAEADAAGAKWFAENPGEDEFYEYQIFKASAEITRYPEEVFIDPDYGEARPGEAGFQHPDHEGKEPMKWED